MKRRIELAVFLVLQCVMLAIRFGRTVSHPTIAGVFFLVGLVVVIAYLIRELCRREPKKRTHRVLWLALAESVFGLSLFFTVDWPFFGPVAMNVSAAMLSLRGDPPEIVSATRTAPTNGTAIDSFRYIFDALARDAQ